MKTIYALFRGIREQLMNQTGYTGIKDVNFQASTDAHMHFIHPVMMLFHIPSDNIDGISYTVNEHMIGNTIRVVYKDHIIELDLAPYKDQILKEIGE